jgi:hypothetical protein
MSKFDHALCARIPTSWAALIEVAAKAQDTTPSQYVREAIAVSLAQDGFSTAAPEREYALICDGALVEPNVPIHMKHLYGKSITTFWPTVLEAGYEWWPLETEGEPDGTMPNYRVAGDRVVRSYGEAA